MTLNEARDRAALAWLAERVSEAIIAIGDPVRSADLEVWLSKMPKYDRHAADAPKVDDGHAHIGDGWYDAAKLQPPHDVEVCVRTPKGNLFRTVRCTEHGDIAYDNDWRYI